MPADSLAVNEDRTTPRSTIAFQRAFSNRISFCAVLWLVQRVLIEGVGLVTTAVAGPARHGTPGFFGLFANWDTGWFACIVQNGYFGARCADGAGTERFAFFPLYPLLARGAAMLVDGPVPDPPAVTFALWLVAAVASFGAVVALFFLAEKVHDASVARRACALFLFGPYALFLVASYSESLYLAAGIAAWYFCVSRRYVWCAVAGVVATASRASGLFLVPAMLVLYVTTTVRGNSRLRVRDVLLVGSSSLGVVGYWVWLASRTGDPLAWFHAQGEGWHRSTRWPWQTLLNQGVHVLREPRWDWQVQAVLEVVFAIGLVVAVIVLVRDRNWPAVALVGLTALSLMTSNSYLSLARNTVTLFPLFVLLGARVEQRRGFVVLLLGGAVLLVFNAVQFALGNWAD